MQDAAARASDIERIRDFVGPTVPRRRLQELLEAASGDVQRAIDLHFGAEDDTTAAADAASDDVVEVAASSAQHAGWQPQPIEARPRSLPRASRQAGISAWQALNDYVDLSSSTDNDFDPAARSSEDEEVVNSVELSEDDDGDEDAAYFAAAAQRPVKDWSNLSFSILRDCAVLKGDTAKHTKALPLEEQRAPNGHLFCRDVAEVPEKAVVPVKYPVHLGSLKLPLAEMHGSARVRCTCQLGVQTGLHYSEWSQRFLIAHYFSYHFEKQAIMKIFSATKKKEPEHVATVGDMSKGVTAITRLCYHLAELQEGGHIELKAKLAQGPAHPEFIKLAEADACGEAGSNNGRARKPMHAVVDIFLTEKAVVAGGEDPADVGVPIKNRGKGKKSTLLNTWQVHSRHIAPVLNWLLLTDPEGLQIGPDSDGLVNFCDQAESSKTTPAAQAEEELCQEAAEGSNALLATADAAAGPSKVAKSKRPPSEESSHEAVTVQQMLDSVALPDDAATAVAPGALRSIPKQFQLQGLQWMLDRERQGDALGRGQLHLHPEWLQLLSADKQLLHYNRLANHFSDTFISAPVGGTCGGFLCDEMGLGKTLQSLMLILANPPPASWPVHDLDKNTHDKSEAVPIKTTLIVMPANLLQQWQDEMAKHVQDGALKWCVYDGRADWLAAAQQPGKKGTRAGAAAAAAAPAPPTRTPTRRTRSQRGPAAEGGFVHVVKPLWCLDPDGVPVQMQHQDIALMTYEQLRKELSASDKCPLLQFGFWRVMLDEAQLVAATSSVAAQMTSSLWRRHAWVVTGTPITARLEEIQGLLEFLAYEPFYHNATWRALLQWPLGSSHPQGSLPLRSLLQGVMLRRTKAHVGDQLSLPPCEHIDRWVALSSVERSFYDRLHKQVISTQANHQASQKQRRRTTGPTSIAGRLVRQFTELRQSCCHPQIVRTSDSMLGKDRLSMQDIMARLTHKAYNEYDQAARAHATARLLQEAVSLPAGSRPSHAYMQLMQQITAAAQVGASLDMADLIDHRASDGTLPDPQIPNGHAAPPSAAATVASMLKRKPEDNQQETAATREQSQAPSTKRQKLQTENDVQMGGVNDAKADGSEEAEGHRAEQATALDNRPQSLSALGQSSASDMGRYPQASDVDKSQQLGQSTPDAANIAGPSGSNQAAVNGPDPLRLNQTALPDQADRAGHTGLRPTALPGQAHGSTAPHPGTSGQAKHQSSRKSNELRPITEFLLQGATANGAASDEAASNSPGPIGVIANSPSAKGVAPNGPGTGLATATGHNAQAASVNGLDPPGAAANRSDEAAPSTSATDHDAQLASTISLDPQGAAANSSVPQQATANGLNQVGPSTSAVPDQASEEEVSPEVKEQKEQARNRVRAWRKVLLDGLDLLVELSAAAAAADESDAEGDYDLAQECQDLEEQSMQLRAELGLVPELGPLPQEAPRFSKRARQMAPDTELGAEAAVHLSEAHAAHLRAAKVILKAYDDLKARRRGSAPAAATAVASSLESVKSKWRTVQHLYHKQLEAAADVKGKGRAETNGPAGPSQAGLVVEQSDTNTCPICLDECAARTVTSCGHYFCSACIHELVEGGASGEVPCPLCRTPLHSRDLYDAVTEEEAEEARQAASVQGDYGSKVSALLIELAAMKQADPTAKAVVFSSWSRLLRLVEEALQDNGISCTSIAGVQAASRVSALKRFTKDPDCTVLTVVMSTGGGAAGLTLTVASHMFLMEPNLNPGLEAQAAARVYRLGQTKPTKVVRLLTEGTIEKSILTHQRKKLQTPGQGQTGVQLQEAELLAGNTLADLLAAHP